MENSTSADCDTIDAQLSASWSWLRRRHPIARAYIEAAPVRMIWGTDWPHVQWRKQRMMNDAEEVELLYRYADNDAALLQKILVDNPARLHGFE